VVSSDHLDPGKVGIVKAIVDTSNVNGPATKRVMVYSNDLVTPVVTVELVLTVTPQQPQPGQQPQLPLQMQKPQPAQQPQQPQNVQQPQH